MHWQTHTVFNQPVPLNNSNLYLSDGALCEAVIREGAGWDSDLLASIGQQLGTAESLELGRLANAFPPELLRYDSQGQRLDDVRFHPAWHLLMQGLCANRVHNLASGRRREAGNICRPGSPFHAACAGGSGHVVSGYHDFCRHAVVTSDVTCPLSRLVYAAAKRPL